jgi:hypothetical protein
MDSSPDLNGKHADSRGMRSSNPYVDALTGDQPPEIADFEISTYPYANVVPPISRLPQATPTAGPDDEPFRTRPPFWLRAMSILVLTAMLLAIVLGVASHFYG